MANKVGLAIYLAFVVYMAFSAWTHPRHNWDMIPYIASALAYEEQDMEKVHQKTYSHVKHSVTPKKFRLLAKTGQYRYDIASTPDYLAQALPGYKVKPLYVASIYVAYKLGIDIVSATLLISIASAVSLALLVLVWISHHYPGIFGCLLSFLLLMGAGIEWTARFSTPDMLSAFLVVLGAYFLLEHQRKSIGAAVLILSIFARIDNVILVTLLFFYLAFLAPRPHRLNMTQFSAFSAITVACYFSIGAYADGHSWSVLFHHAFIHLLLEPATAVVSISIPDYLSIVGEKLAKYFGNLGFVQLVLFSSAITMSSYLQRNLRGFFPVDFGLGMVILVALVVHFAALPLLLPRYFVAHYVLLGIFSLRQIADVVESADVRPAQRYIHHIKQVDGNSGTA